MRPSRCDQQHGAHLARRAAGNIDKGQQLIRRATLEALRNIVGNRKSRPLQLVAETGAETGWRMVDELINTVIERSGSLPDGKILEAAIRRHVDDGIFPPARVVGR